MARGSFVHSAYIGEYWRVLTGKYFTRLRITPIWSGSVLGNFFGTRRTALYRSKAQKKKAEKLAKAKAKLQIKKKVYKKGHLLKTIKVIDFYKWNKMRKKKTYKFERALLKKTLVV
jgi:hypothetical protein